MDKLSTIKFVNNPLSLIVIWAFILEFPVRYLLSPDPWIHGSNHWYFNQPMRIFIETVFILLAIWPFFVLQELNKLMRVHWSKSNLLYLVLGIIGSVLIFSLQQWDEFKTIESNHLWRYVPLWFATGLIIGIGQELTFRGLIFTGIDKRLGTKWAIIISTLCFVFGSIHSVRMYAYLINGYIFETLILIGVFILSGLFFVWIRIETKNIFIPSIIHGIGNGITWATFIVVKLHGSI